MNSTLISHQLNPHVASNVPNDRRNSIDLTCSLLSSSKADSSCMNVDNHMVGASDMDIEVLNEGENYNKLIDTTPKNKSNDRIVPCEGKEFTSLEQFEVFYYAYALSEGFTVRVKRMVKFDRTEIVRYRQYVCSCAGFCAEKKSNDEVDEGQEKMGRKTLTRRSGCPVTITISKKKNVWRVGSVNNKHNHLLVSPNSRAYLRKPSGMPLVAKNLVEKFSEADLPIGKIPALLNSGVELNVSQRSCWNHRRDLRKMNLDRGDADFVFQYCRQKHLQDPNFFYAIQTDDDDRMVNFFWIDSIARQFYERFGDVVVFDMTYKTNKYILPLANFVGANHHTQTIMFGCALLQNEEEETFVWLFETWLKAVDGRLPISILTDQDRAITNAIARVFPNVTHRFCLWHILKKFPEKYGSLYKDKSPFSRELKNCLYHSITTEQFDSEWEKVMSKYKLASDEWLVGLFDIRRSWIPVYNRTIFFAGKNTTQRCESIHSFFDSFLNKGTTLREFVVKYESALEQRYISEHAERFTSVYKKPNLKVNSPIEEHAAYVYTRSMFNQFQEEFLHSLKLKREKQDKNGSCATYKISNLHNPHEAFLVTLDVESLEVSCQCHMFEFKGILCSHILSVFNKKDVEKIPPKYILPRWTKKAAEGIHIPLFSKDGNAIARDLKFNNALSRLRPYLHVSDETLVIVMEALDQTLKKVSVMQEAKEETTINAATEESVREEQGTHLKLGDPHISKIKGRKKESAKESKNGRLKSGFEIGMENSKQLKRRCKECGEFGHYSSTCERRKRTKCVEPVPEENS